MVSLLTVFFTNLVCWALFKALENAATNKGLNSRFKATLLCGHLRTIYFKIKLDDKHTTLTPHNDHFSDKTTIYYRLKHHYDFAKSIATVFFV